MKKRYRKITMLIHNIEKPLAMFWRGDLQMEEKQYGCCSVRKKHRESDEYDRLITRLNRIEGQIRGIKKMLEDERYCVDILTQTSAAAAAINAFNKELLAEHVRTCVVNDIKEGKEETVDELCNMLQKLMK